MSNVTTNPDNALAKIDTALLEKSFAEADFVLMKKYQYELESYPIIVPSKAITDLEITKHTRLFQIESISYDKQEDNLTKLSNVYNALSAVNGSVILILDSDGEQVHFYIGTKTVQEKDIHIAFKTLEKTLQGNFPGCVIKNQTNRRIKNVVEQLFEYKDDSSLEEHRSISTVCGISSLRETIGSGDKKGFTQGIEKLIDSMRGEVYSMILMADPVEQKQIERIRNGYEQLYTRLVPFASAEMSLGYTSGQTLTDSITEGVADTVSESLTLSQSHSHTSSNSTAKTKGGGVSFLGFVSGNTSKTTTTTETDTYTEGRADTKGTSQTKSFNIGLSNAISTGESRNLQIRTEEKSVKSLLDRIEKQLQRLEECGDLGMWNTAAYFIADDIQTSKTAASTYQALIRGENSGLEAIAVNTWSHHEQDAYRSNNYLNLVEYLRKLAHPAIFIGENVPVVTPTSLISGAELTIQAGLPQRSVSGLAVAQYASFGREVLTHHGSVGSAITLGNVYHMGVKEALAVKIDKQSLASHTFITGSTGSGKSNTVYQILSELSKKQVPFLVIEPAKGEYKHIFGERKDVSVFGTNPAKTPLLKINPFKFPEDIHVLEHIDRLIEIFNVCWPMYAAMPAVLKDAVERAYTKAGWNLDESMNQYGPELFPNFMDVLAELHHVINESDFSEELKSNYIGALVTRVKSLTNGINGQIFASDEIDPYVLFNSNTIVDLSRVASIETKAIIMGILVMRLQEHRIAEGGMNKPLRHMTILEEAHHLLKRTATEQTSEGANLLGKSVEMLANSIAEMRTYGEGFIIADQSPNLLDLSVIRNTNTKIILRLPDLSDRELTGRAASLNDDQIVELAKLPTGVAAVYQNNWLDPVLCQIDPFDEKAAVYRYERNVKAKQDDKLKNTLIRCLLGGIAGDRVEYSIDDLKERIFKANFATAVKLKVIHALSVEKRLDIKQVSAAVSGLFDFKNLYSKADQAKGLEEWNQLLLGNIDGEVNQLGRHYQHLILQCMLREKSLEDDSFKEKYEKWTELMRGTLL